MPKPGRREPVDQVAVLGLSDLSEKTEQEAMLTVTRCLILAAFVVTVGAVTGKMPLWPAVLILVLVDMLAVLPR